jgi:hypothetical protein
MPLTTWTPYNRIGRPLEAHGARTVGEYYARQAQHIEDMKRARPELAWRDPFIVESASPRPFISGGRWVVICPCGNAPSFDPEWRVALCFECGAQYVGVAVPKEWESIEAALMARPSMTNRHMTLGETAADLIDENRARGVVMDVDTQEDAERFEEDPELLAQPVKTPEQAI